MFSVVACRSDWSLGSSFVGVYKRVVPTALGGRECNRETQAIKTLWLSRVAALETPTLVPV
jgi:hypothetical protein